MALPHTAGTASASGGTFAAEDAHLFDFRDGKWACFAAYTHTTAQADAFRGQ